jgi:protein-S-isoprenylcysteine O-methyltransferase Ste14
MSILVSTIIYVLILLRLTILNSYWFEIDFSNCLIIKYVGLAFVSFGFVFGILALIAMKNSWRVGIKYDQKTDLVTSGIYRFSRNPYFFSYDILILGYILIFPSIILIILHLALVIIFHNMILEEEKYLESVHGDLYLDYKRKVKRYLTIKF